MDKEDQQEVYNSLVRVTQKWGGSLEERWQAFLTWHKGHFVGKGVCCVPQNIMPGPGDKTSYRTAVALSVSSL